MEAIYSCPDLSGIKAGVNLKEWHLLIFSQNFKQHVFFTMFFPFIIISSDIDTYIHSIKSTFVECIAANNTREKIIYCGLPFACIFQTNCLQYVSYIS